MTETEVTAFAELCKKHSIKGERVVIMLDEKLQDLPSDSSRTFYTLRVHPKGLVGVYNKRSTVEMIREDIFEFLKENGSV